MAELTETVAPRRARGLPASGERRQLIAASVGGVAIAACAVTGFVFAIVNGPAETPRGIDYTLPILVACASFGLPGALLLARGPAPLIGALTMTTGLSLGLAGALTGWAVLAVERDPGSLPGADAAIWVLNWCWVPGYCAIALVLLVLPDGRLPSARWRPVAVAAAVGVAAIAAGTAVGPYPRQDLPVALGEAVNPLEAPTLATVLTTIGALMFIPCALLSLASLVLRFRRSSGAQRAQLKWVALGGAATIVLLAVACAAGENGDIVSIAFVIPLPASIAIAVLRHGLWDVDLVINRSLVWAALTVGGVAGYVLIVSAIGELVDETVAGIVAVGLLAVALQPLHRRVQQAVNQLVYGDRDDPAAALARLGDRLVAAGEADEVLPAVAETVARALRLPHVSVTVEGGSSAAHDETSERDDALVTIDLRYQGHRVGAMAVAPREPSRGLSAADRRALERIGRQVAVAAHAVRLTHDLRRSRERLVQAREEERRRLRHDLHDELGPTLAGLALELESARDLVRERPLDVYETLDRAAARARDSVADVRRLVYDLRPPTLDDLGLVGALRQRAQQLSAGGLAVSVETESDLGELPAAAEAAAYRIVSEAFANAARHSGARICSAGLTVADGALQIRVRDDGQGLDPRAAAGVGLGSMRERAEELGGSFQAGAGPDGRGTEVQAMLPLEGR